MDEKRTPGPNKQLTPQQLKFATLLVYGVEGNPITKSEAARLAGFSDTANGAAVYATRLTDPNRYPLVCAHISNLRDEVRQKYGISYEAHLEELGKIRDMAKKDRRNLAAAATTEIARGKVGGFYVDQKIVRHGKIADMNLAQLFDKMKTIRERNERMAKAKQFLDEASAESKSEHKTLQQKKLSSPQQIDDPDSTS